MNCGEVRECLFAFLDNELETPLSIELQRHLDSCPRCARETEIERAIGRRLTHFVNRDAELQPLDAPTMLSHLSANLPVRTSGFGRSARHWGRVTGIAAALLIVVLAGFWWSDRSLSDRDFRGTSFAHLLVADFEHFLASGSELHIRSSDRKIVGDWLRKTGLSRTELPDPSDPRSRLVGGRKCTIDGRPAAFLAYELHGSPAALIVLPAGPGSLAGMTEVRRGASAHWVDRCKGHTVVACQRDSLVYAAVSAVSEEMLLALMTDATNEGY